MHHNQSQSDGTNNMQYVIGYSKFGVSIKRLNTELVRYFHSKTFVSRNLKGLIININDMFSVSQTLSKDQRLGFSRIAVCESFIPFEL